MRLLKQACDRPAKKLHVAVEMTTIAGKVLCPLKYVINIYNLRDLRPSCKSYKKGIQKVFDITFLWDGRCQALG